MVRTRNECLCCNDLGHRLAGCLIRWVQHAMIPFVGYCLRRQKLDGSTSGWDRLKLVGPDCFTGGGDTLLRLAYVGQALSFHRFLDSRR